MPRHGRRPCVFCEATGGDCCGAIRGAVGWPDRPACEGIAMKVLCVSAGLDAAFGGPPVATANSVIAARQAGVDISVVFPHGNLAQACAEPAARKMLAAGVDVLSFPISIGHTGAARAWGISWPLARWMWRRAGDYDVIHAQSAWAMPTLIATIVGRLRRRPVVLSPHETLTTFDLGHAHHPVLRLAKVALARLYRGGVVRGDFLIVARTP